VQETEMKKFMREEGYSNKGEFFRFLIKFYKYNKPSVQQQFEEAADELAKVVTKAAKHPKFKRSLEEQFKDV